MLRSQHRVYDGSGEVARTQDVWGAEGISGRVKFLPLAWAGMPKTSFRKNSDSPPKPETLLIVLNAQGQLTQVQTLAFHEPPEYQPSQRWYAQMFNLPLEDISFRAKIQGISGATLSSRSAIDSVRKVLAVYQINVLEKQ
ncbi:hypothetical protein BMR07_10725 [Methylococcaceae bacterium CS1]|nr:hypothetical protein BMR11_11445 [Methylococcaceae bacterium CS5]TXL05104.1 hypothetical protein BMR07_10725 [Methylococcaceae bacterium CS1]